MKPRLLARHAEGMGIDESLIDVADVSTDRKGSLIDLILRHAVVATPGGRRRIAPPAGTNTVQQSEEVSASGTNMGQDIEDANRWDELMSAATMQHDDISPTT